MYMFKGKKYEHQRHMNQLRPRYTENVIEDKEVPIEVLYDVFDIPDSPIPIIVKTNQLKEKEGSGTF